MILTSLPDSKAVEIVQAQRNRENAKNVVLVILKLDLKDLFPVINSEMIYLTQIFWRYHSFLINKTV